MNLFGDFLFLIFCYYLAPAFVRKFIQYQKCPVLANVVSFFLWSIAYFPLVIQFFDTLYIFFLRYCFYYHLDDNLGYRVSSSQS